MSEYFPKGNRPKWAPGEFFTFGLWGGAQQVWSQGWCEFLALTLTWVQILLLVREALSGAVQLPTRSCLSRRPDHFLKHSYTSSEASGIKNFTPKDPKWSNSIIKLQGKCTNAIKAFAGRPVCSAPPNLSPSVVGVTKHCARADSGVPCSPMRFTVTGPLS